MTNEQRERLTQLGAKSQEQVKDEQIGRLGTKKRDAYEKEVLRLIQLIHQTQSN